MRWYKVCFEYQDIEEGWLRVYAFVYAFCKLHASKKFYDSHKGYFRRRIVYIERSK